MKNKMFVVEATGGPTNKLQPINDKMLDLMRLPSVKEAGFTMKLHMKDKSIRKGVYKDLVADPLHRIEFKDTLFIKFEVKRENDMIVYLPLTDIEYVDWSH